MDPVFDLINPSIYLGEWEIREPITTLTDLLVAGMCVFAYWKMGKLGLGHRVHHLMRGYFLFTALGTTFGGVVGHGLQAYLSWEWKMLGWLVTSLAMTLYALSSVELAAPKLGPRYQPLLRNLVCMLYGLLLLAMLWPETRSFFTVRLFTSVLLLGLIFPIHFFLWFRVQNPGSRWVMISMLMAMATGAVFSYQLAFDRWFNHHDLCHVLMTVYSYFLFLAAQRFIPADWPPVSSSAVAAED